MSASYRPKPFADDRSSERPAKPDELDRCDVLGTRTLGTITGGERDLLSLMQLLIHGTLHALRVKEQVLCTTCVDEPKPLFRQLLDRSFGHLQLSIMTARREIARQTLPIARRAVEEA